jgi:cephalosporin-C deacetylase-like acetyl esterase
VARWLTGFLIAVLGPRATVDAQQLTFTPYHANGIYNVGERVGWSVEVAPGQTAAKSYDYTLKRDGLTAIGHGTLDLSAGRATIETSLDRPGMLLVEVRPPAGTIGFHGASKSEDGRVLLGAAVAPNQIRPSERRPSDFDAFWASELRRLDSVAPEPVVTPGESGRTDVEYFTIRLNNVNGAHIYGQLAKPARPSEGGSGFPALLILQWASAPHRLQREWVTDYAARGWLVLNVQPHDVPVDMPDAFYKALPQLLKDYRLIGRHSRVESYFLPMYLGDYRAADYLASRADWDGRTLVVMGTSMGGQQGFAVAGLHPRVTALIANVPAGCDLLGPLRGRAASYPNWDVTQPDVRRTAGYFDAVNFAPRVRARTLISIGFIDETTPPAGIWAAFNQLPGLKESIPLVDSPHNHMATQTQVLPYTRRSAEWLEILARGGDPLAVNREAR